MLNVPVDLAGNLARVNDQIAEAAIAAGRKPEEITLVGVSKTQPVDALAEAVRAGLRHLGENRVQEASEKFPRLAELLVGGDHDRAPAEQQGGRRRGVVRPC
jgi:uncharacterized pyridoxal phosphate-containing UPF0001 family protein